MMRGGDWCEVHDVCGSRERRWWAFGREKSARGT